MENLEGKILRDRYIVEQKIGEGGMSVVYRAFDRVDNKTVAVKVMKDELLKDNEFRAKFRAESMAVSILSHKNILKIYDVNFGNDIQYIVMEYIDGITLKDYLKSKGQIPWQEAFKIASEVLQALNHAHVNGIIHRDIKPQNIMLVNGTRQVKVTDFGIARIDNGTGFGTDDSVVMGSVNYISPEQAAGDKTDARSDIYSLGVTIYEMVTGTVPFKSDSAVAIRMMHMKQAPQPPRDFCPSLPVGASQIIQKAMRKQPSKRFQSANEMFLDVTELLKNPNRKFNYDTLGSKQTARNTVPAAAPAQKKFASGVPIGYDAGEKNDATERKTAVNTKKEAFDAADKALAKRNNLPWILSSIILGIVLIGIIVVWFFFVDTKEVDVPNFVGKIVSSIEKDDEYKYFFDRGMIEQNLVYTTDHKEGYIISQSVPADSKIKVSHSKGTLIRLNVAFSSKEMVIPEVAKDENLDTVRSRLTKMGFKVKAEAVEDKSLQEGMVIKLDPKSGEKVSYGTEIIIYYAVEAAKKIEVPDVVGDNAIAAKKGLEDKGFTVKIEYRESGADKAGVVLSQSVASGTVVDPKKTEVNLVVGTSGNNSTCTLDIKLPDVEDEKKRQSSIYVYIDDQLYKTYSGISLDGSVRSVELGGTKSSTFKIVIGDTTIAIGAVDFSADKPVVSKTKTFPYAAAVTKAPPTTATTTKPQETKPNVILPNFEGVSFSDYYDQVMKLGFDVEVKEKNSDTVPEGEIISVSGPRETPLDKVSDARVVITVSKGKGE